MDIMGQNLTQRCWEESRETSLKFSSECCPFSQLSKLEISTHFCFFLNIKFLRSRNVFKGEPENSCLLFNNNNNIVKYYKLLALVLPPLFVYTPSAINICCVYLYLPDLDLHLGQWNANRHDGMTDLSLGLQGQRRILFVSLVPLPLPWEGLVFCSCCLLATQYTWSRQKPQINED